MTFVHDFLGLIQACLFHSDPTPSETSLNSINHPPPLYVTHGVIHYQRGIDWVPLDTILIQHYCWKGWFYPDDGSEPYPEEEWLDNLRIFTCLQWLQNIERCN